MIAGIIALGIAVSSCSRTIIVKKGDDPNVHPEEQHKHEKYKREKHKHEKHEKHEDKKYEYKEQEDKKHEDQKDEHDQDDDQDVVVHHHGGPPPHAPAHGYRHKHSDGSVLLFDSQFGLYIVTGHVDVYYHDASYYRIYKGMIETSNKANGPWHKANSKSIPDGMHKKVAIANESDDEGADAKGKGNDKDKDDDKGKGSDKDKDDDKGKGSDKDKDDDKGKGNDKDKDDDKGKGKGKKG